MLVVGTPTFDAWHVAAHLDDAARYSGVLSLTPTLLRWQPPLGAPPHLRHSADELEAADSRSAVLVVAPDDLHEDALERLADVRRRGAALFAVTASDELSALAHDGLVVPPGNASGPATPAAAGEDFSLATHLVTVSAGTTSRAPRRLSLRAASRS